jgi:hypothetical protein
MDPIKILKRAWHILWNYRALWLFGVILALTVGGTGRWPNYPGDGRQRNGDQEGYQIPPSEWLPEAREGIQEWLDQGMPPFHLTQGDLSTLIAIGIAILVVMLILVVIGTIFRYVAETALIRMVDEYEATGAKPGVRQGLRYGWSRSAWRLFLINLLVRLPLFLLVLSLVLIGVVFFLLVIQGNPLLTGFGIVSGIGFVFLAIFLGVSLSVLLSLLRHFFWRACVLEQVGVVEALRRGFGLVKRNWKDVGLMWLLMVGIGILWLIVFFFGVLFMIPLLIVTAIGGVVVGGVPTLVVVGVTSLFLGGYWPWVVGLVVGVPIFLLVTFSPLIFLNGLALVFTSSVWTLTYRELRALQGLALEAPAQVAPQAAPDEPVAEEPMGTEPPPEPSD